MNTMTMWSRGAIAAVVFALAQSAIASSSAGSQEMKTAFSKAAEGPDELRRYVERTRAIYALNYADVMAAYEASRVAAEKATQIAEGASK